MLSYNLVVTYDILFPPGRGSSGFGWRLPTSVLRLMYYSSCLSSIIVRPSLHPPPPPPPPATGRSVCHACVIRRDFRLSGWSHNTRAPTFDELCIDWTALVHWSKISYITRTRIIMQYTNKVDALPILIKFSSLSARCIMGIRRAFCKNGVWLA